MTFEITNRRYTGSKNKLILWIRDVLNKECKDCNSFCDIFAGTGSVTFGVLDLYDTFILNDFLYSNEVIYKSFYGTEVVDDKKIKFFKEKYTNIAAESLYSGFVANSYGDKYFSKVDAMKIDYIRDDIEENKGYLNKREYSILIASLLYSLDRISNTVGHYDAYIKNNSIKNSFIFNLVNYDNNVYKGKKFVIYREDSNQLASKISSDITYIDPPYSSRQYSRFYHVLETITKWDKPELFGEALKPEPENISEYSKAKAAYFFEQLVNEINSKYIVVSYNNTYKSKSKSSKNKMTLEEIEEILSSIGNTKVFSKEHKAFSAGKTDLNEHKEFLFVTKVGIFNE